MKYLTLSIPGVNGSPVPIDSGLPSGVPTGGLDTTGVSTISAFIILFVVFAILFALWNVWKGGWDMITSHGHKEGLKRGWERVVFALLGLVFVFLTFFAISIVNSLFGTDMFPFLKFN